LARGRTKNQKNFQAISPLNFFDKREKEENIAYFCFLQNFHLQKNKVLKPKFRKFFGKSFCKEKQWAMVRKDLKEICVFWMLVIYVPRSCFYRLFMSGQKIIERVMTFEKIMLRVITLNFFFKTIYW